MDPFNSDPELSPPFEAEWVPRRKFQDRRWRHALLLLLTFASTTLAGAFQYAAFRHDAGFATTSLNLTATQLLAGGLWYSGTLLLILGCHELGHYFACRYYDVDASLPYFLPMPFVLTGTLGAFIRIREPFPSKRALFDIGIAGPIAGFVLAVPALVIGLALSNVVPVPDPLPPGTFEFGEPLLYQFVSWAIWGTTPQGFTVNMHPMAGAAWFGLLATALNLIPVGQLDGGHISYAVLGRRSSLVTLVMIGIGVALSFVSSNWTVWTGLMVLMLFLFGRHHPRTYDEAVPLDSTRLGLAFFALVMFVLCFTPVPLEILSVRP